MLERTLSKTVQSISKGFPVILLTGPRQVGKTTLLKNLSNARETGMEIGHGTVLCLRSDSIPIGKNVTAIPFI